MPTQDCGHESQTTLAQACLHCAAAGLEHGYKSYTGQGQSVIYQCEACYDVPESALSSYCPACAQLLDGNAEDWTHCGLPGVLRAPKPFVFTARELVFEELKNTTVRAFAALAQLPGEGVVFTANGQLLRLNWETAVAQLITTLDDTQVCREGSVQLVLSDDGQFFAITSAYTGSKNTASAEGERANSNTGVVGCLRSGRVLMPLDCGDYHTELTEFPVVFFSDQQRTLMVHATDWNRLDITDPLTGECLTTRASDVEAPATEHKQVYSEWSGRLKVSPDQTQIATIGWMWHPVGSAFTWSLAQWVSHNRWEAENGASKRILQQWSYFWDSSFVWLDDRRLCIWGHDIFTDDKTDCPANTAVVCDVVTGQCLSSFAGPTNWPFVFDIYLFTAGINDEGLAIWEVETGCLLHEEPCDKLPTGYHPASHEFLSFGEAGHVKLLHWRAG